MRPLHNRNARTASPSGQKTMKLMTISASHAGRPMSSSFRTMSCIAVVL